MINIPFEQFKNDLRVPAIDFLKLLASIFVILSHCMLKYIDNGDCNPLFNLIWLTQMPLFMFASGMVSPKVEKVDSINKYFKREFRNSLFLLVPCLTYLFFSCLISKKNIGTGFVEFYKNPESNLWFLWVLFLIHIIFDFGIYLSSKTIFKYRGFIPDVLSILVSIFIVIIMVSIRSSNLKILGIKLLAYYIPYFVFGHITHSLLTRIAHNNSSHVFVITVIICFLSLFLLVFECFYFKSIHQFEDNNIKYLLLRILGSVSAIVVFFIIALFITSNKIGIKVSKLGMFSLESYYFHALFLKLLNYSSQSTATQWLIAFGTTGLLIIIVVSLIVIMYNTPFLHLIIFGKTFSRYRFEEKLPKIVR